MRLRVAWYFLSANAVFGVRPLGSRDALFHLNGLCRLVRFARTPPTLLLGGIPPLPPDGLRVTQGWLRMSPGGDAARAIAVQAKTHRWTPQADYGRRCSAAGRRCPRSQVFAGR